MYITVKKHWVARLFSLNKDTAYLRFNRNSLQFINDKKIYKDTITNLYNHIVVKQGFLFSSLQINSDKFCGKLTALKSRTCIKLVSIVERSRRLFVLSFLRDYESSILEAVEQFNILLSNDRYLTDTLYKKWHEQYWYLNKIFDFQFYANELTDILLNNISQLKNYFDKATVRSHNTKFVEAEIIKYEFLFNNIESNPLTLKQKESVVTDEDNNLIIAGAGSGKTSVIIAKIAYILLKGLAQPDEILLISFSNEVKREIIARLKNRFTKFNGLPNNPFTCLPTVSQIQVDTFHGFGNKINKHYNKSLKVITDDVKNSNFEYTNFVENIFIELLKDDQLRELFLNVFVYQDSFYHNALDYDDEKEYKSLLANSLYRTMGGHHVKSFEELEIANFLFLHKINYSYEEVYPYKVSSNNRKEYKPDFYLTDYDIYLEHFGIDRNNKTAPFIKDQQSYVDGIKWKIGVHKKNKTKLIQTFSYERFEGNLISNLIKKFEDTGVAVIKDDNIQSFLDKLGRDIKYFKRAIKLLKSTIDQFYGNYLNYSQLKSRANEFHDPIRILQYLQLFEAFTHKYKNELANDKRTDFPSMINNAIKIYQNYDINENYKYIIVDEFQDTSRGKIKLLQQLKINSHQHCKLMCVGDDWQSIYRFTGSDVSVMKDFPQHFGTTESIKLDMTFRSNDQITAVASTFIQKNPKQLNKEITAFNKANNKPITIYYYESAEQKFELFDQILQTIEKQNKKTDVFVIGRYKVTDDHILDTITPFKEECKNLKVKPMTAHKSKGLEAKQVIILDLIDQTLGFPSRVDSDPILELFLPYKEEFRYAEERRLFYVSLTRAKDHIFLLVDKNNPSCFVRELEVDYPDKIVSINKPRFCNECDLGVLKKKVSKYDVALFYYFCSNIDGCGYLEMTCPICKDGLVKKINNYTHQCDNKVCKQNFKSCRDCDHGFLVERMNAKSGRRFYGCSSFSITGCRYSE